MSKRVLWVTIADITLNANGDVPGQAPAAGDHTRNAVMATLTYPRSGAPTVSSGQQYAIASGTPFVPDQTNFFVSGLFKEEVQDQTILQVKVTDTDKTGKAEKLFLSILGSLVSAGLTAATGGLTGFLGAIAGVGVSKITTGMAGLSGDQVFVVGQTDMITLNVDDLPTDKNNPLRMALGLTVPDDVEKPFFTPGPDGSPVRNHLHLAKGSNNGVIHLLVAAVPA